MEEPPKGTVMSFATMFPPDEAQKAAKRLEDVIAEKQKETDHLKDFMADNTNLINLVSRLPDELHHEIMVPFGKVAFFPGRLIHTNEFMVFLGEGYYAERTSRQTVEILKRRGEALDSQIESLKANIKDLKAEASFFDATAFEAAEGLVEIREDYVEKISSKRQFDSENKKVTVEDDEYARIISRLDELEKEELEAEENQKVTVEDDEYARIMSRLDELEKEELEAEGDNENDEVEQTSSAESNTESDKEDDPCNMAESDSGSHEYVQAKAQFSQIPYQTSSKIRKSQTQAVVENTVMEALPTKFHNQLDVTDQSNGTGLAVRPVPVDKTSHGRSLTHSAQKSLPLEKHMVFPEANKIEAVPSSRNEVPMQSRKSGYDSSKAFTGSIVEHIGNIEKDSREQIIASSQTSVHTSKPGFDSSKAFTGSIVERNYNAQATTQGLNAPSSQPTTSQPSKPISRFKMQRS